MKLFKLFSTYTLITIITAGIPFLLMPLLTHYLTTTDYGELSLFNTYVTILIPLISLGTTGFFTIEYFKKSSKRFKEVFSSVSRVPLLTTFVFLILAILFGDILEFSLELSSNWLIFIPIIAFLTVIYDTLLSMLIIQKKATTYGLVSIVKTIIEVSLSLLLIISFKMNWEGRIISWLIAVFIVAIYALFYFKKKKWLQVSTFNKVRVKQALIFGIPLVPHMISKFLINQSDTIFIAKMVSIEDTGIYRVGYQFGFILSIISGAFISIYTPFLYEKLNNVTEQKKREIVKLSLLFITVLIILTLILTMSADFIFSVIIHEDFIDGAQFVFWTALSYLFWGGYLIFAGYIFYLKKTKILAYLSALGIAINLLLNYFFILEFGVIGVSYATAISFFITFVIIAFVSNKLYPMPWLSFYKKNNEPI